MRLVGPIYRPGVDRRIDDAHWFALPAVLVFLNHQLTHPIGRARLDWTDEGLIVATLPFDRPVTGRDFENMGRLVSLPYLDFSYRITQAESGADGADTANRAEGVHIAEVSLVSAPTVFDLPGWTMED